MNGPGAEPAWSLSAHGARYPGSEGSPLRYARPAENRRRIWARFARSASRNRDRFGRPQSALEFSKKFFTIKYCNINTLARSHRAAACVIDAQYRIIAWVGSYSRHFATPLRHVDSFARTARTPGAEPGTNRHPRADHNCPSHPPTCLLPRTADMPSSRSARLCPFEQIHPESKLAEPVHIVVHPVVHPVAAPAEPVKPSTDAPTAHDDPAGTPGHDAAAKTLTLPNYLGPILLKH